MLRWGGSSPAPPAPQCMPSPNKLPSCSAAPPPKPLSCSAPDRADLAQHKGRLSPVCGQCHMAGWGRGEAAGPRPGAEGAEGPTPLALRGQVWENCILGRPGAQSPRSVPDEVVVRVGPAITPQRLGLSPGPAAVTAPPASSWASPSAYATPEPVPGGFQLEPGPLCRTDSFAPSPHTALAAKREGQGAFSASKVEAPRPLCAPGMPRRWPSFPGSPGDGFPSLAPSFPCTRVSKVESEPQRVPHGSNTQPVILLPKALLHFPAPPSTLP